MMTNTPFATTPPRFKKEQAIANGLLCAGMAGVLIHTASKM